MEFSLKLPNSLSNVADLLPSSFSEYSTQLLWVPKTVVSCPLKSQAHPQLLQTHLSLQLAVCVPVSQSCLLLRPSERLLQLRDFRGIPGELKKTKFVSVCVDAH